MTPQLTQTLARLEELAKAASVNHPGNYVSVNSNDLLYAVAQVRAEAVDRDNLLTVVGAQLELLELHIKHTPPRINLAQTAWHREEGQKIRKALNHSVAEIRALKSPPAEEE